MSLLLGYKTLQDISLIGTVASVSCEVEKLLVPLFLFNIEVILTSNF